jgi:23S rRNA pseudouridine2605 synthase
LNPRLRPSPKPKPAARAQPETQRERLQKLLAAAGLGSRREIEGWIAAGRIAVGGRVAQLGDRAAASDAITIDGVPARLAAARAATRVIAYHKPEGELVTRRDPEGRATVFANLPPLAHGRWIAVGRLDLNSSGLLLFTDSGELANRLMHPRHEVERVYLARVQGELSDTAGRQLLEGVTLDDGEPARFDTLEATGKRAGANRWYRVGLREGRNREVRRLFEAAGCRVSRLRRIRFGAVELPRDLRPGRWFELTAAEVRALG